MEEPFNSSSAPSSSSPSALSSSSSSSSSEHKDDSNNMNVLSSFLNGSREISNYSANFSDLLKQPYPVDAHAETRQGDSEVPEQSTESSSSSFLNPPTVPGEDPNTSSKRKAPDEPTFGVGEDKELSAEDKKVIKKQRRLAKNREAAQLFRQRQKEYISNLETRANQLIAANTEANARAELIASENKLMREQLAYLRNFMKQAVSFSYPYGGPNTPTPTSPTNMVTPQNPFMAGFMPPSGMNVGVDAMGNFIESPHVGLPSSVPLADGTSISFNLMPSTGAAPPSFLSFMPIQAGNPLSFASGSSHAFPSPASIPIMHETSTGIIKDEKELTPD